VATVVSGTWYIGYGDSFSKAELRLLPPGSFYREPANRTHFAETRDEPVIVQITGVGPSSTSYVDPEYRPAAWSWEALALQSMHDTGRVASHAEGHKRPGISETL
jgi:hypothetical protein